MFSSGGSEASHLRLPEGAILLEEVADFPVMERIELDPEISGFSRSDKVQNLPATGSSSEVSGHQMARSEIVPASGISSELSAHQLAQSSSSSSVSVPPSIPDSLVLHWTLVDQVVIPPGFEDAFLGFSEAWTGGCEGRSAEEFVEQ